MSLTRASLVTLRKSLSEAARRKASTAAEQGFKSNPASDAGYMFKLSTWFRYYELLPVIAATGFAGALCAASCTWAFLKEDVRVNNAQNTAAYEQWHHHHRYKAINMRKELKPLPKEVEEVKKQLGPYEVKQ